MKKALVTILALIMILTTACAEELTFQQLAGAEWSFSSGVGGWSTEMKIAEDGTFTGEYHDSEMGETGNNYPDGTVYTCRFSGKMSLGDQLDEHSRAVRIDSLTSEDTPNQEKIENGIRYVTSVPYGLSEGDTMTLYLPGTPTADFTDEMKLWAHLFDAEQDSGELTCLFLYSAQNESGFVGEGFVGGVALANPWADLSAEDLRLISGVPFNVPEGAENVSYRWLESQSLAEIQFTLDGSSYCFRFQPEDSWDGTADNISGIYASWEYEEEVTVGYCSGKLSVTTDGEECEELCLWYDAAPGLMYALSVRTADADGLDLPAVAETVFVPAQSEV